MQTDGSLIGVPCLEDAIDRYPLIVLPDATLADVLTLMSQTLSNRCVVSDVDITSTSVSPPKIRSSCVLVMQGTNLLGIFTERDIVKLTAAGTDFAAVKIVEVMVHPVITLSKESFQDIFAPLFLFRRYRIRHLVVVDESGQVLGIVTPASVRQVLRPSNLLKMRRVSEVMSSQVIHAPPTTPVINLAQMMATHRVSCIVIVEVDFSEELLPIFKPVGIITERDIMQYQALGLNLWETEAQVVMSTPLFLLTPEDSLWFAHQEMQRRRVQRLVVSWDWGTKLGIVTQTSVLRIFDPLEMYGVVETLQQTIVQLENEKTEYLNKQSITGKASINKNTITSENIDKLLSSVQNSMEHLINHPNLPVDIRQMYLNSALTDIQNILLIDRNS
ncbi:MAG: CBS domain-containing protein [Cyanobacteria bacterium P01_A01_bin.80]